uniref:VWFA and cache domain-containing protein 1-like isoform X1 n=3 Tax=Crassostrea virginica TaxID=6565 RepID=A0A8B8B4G3_CRAVI|nr:VWFA and cache domain-containing protein 1-like isoform X1 [Crassostrea virginica]XP_022298300.1 VWFA and cache domain-containing protein 1-like isoform X1 [Crassostrea virginica]
MHILFRGLFLSVLFVYVITDDVAKVAEILEKRVELFGDAILAFSNIEQIYSNDTAVNFLNFTAWNHLDDIVQILEERLQKIVDVLQNNRNSIEKEYNHNEFKAFRDEDLCCNVRSSDLELDMQFNRMVAKSLCFMRSDAKTSKSLGKTYADIFRDNSEKSMFLLWQYFGDTSGNYFQYPAKRTECDGKAWNDPRFQQWFVHTVVPQKKNVVIVLDASGSMSMPVHGINSSAATPSRSMMAREAAMTVLGTLSTTDHVGVVTFNISALSSMCSPTQNSQGIPMMVPATRDNMEALEELMNSSLPSGGTNYGNAFLKAFQLLSHSKQIDPKRFEDSLDMVLFLTDGMPEDSAQDILEELARGQNLVGNSVHVFVYALGDEFKHTNTPKYFLVQLADQNNMAINNSFGPQWQLRWPILFNLQDNTQPTGPVGSITFIKNSDGQRLSHVMGDYYTQFQVNTGANVTFSVPHREPNTGLKMTLSLPTLDAKGQFFGVTALDVHLELTFYEVAHFHLGKDSYAFLVGSSGVVYLHPDLALGDQDLEVYTLDQLEPSLSTDAIYNITNGLEGQEVIKKSVDQSLKSAVCYFKPLSGFSSNFTVVLMIFEDDIKQKRLQSTDSNSFPDFLYHRQGFINTSVVGHDDVCYRDQALVIPANATIKFAPGSFWDLEKSLMYEQNKSYSESHSSFRNTTGFSQHAGVTESVAGDVLLMNKIDEQWKNPTDAIWRYMGTENGVFKVFPGTLVPDILYDPREDRWYMAAVGQSKKYVFIGHPNQNASVITLARAFHQTSKSVHGVIAADITVQHLMTFLYNTAIRVGNLVDSAWMIMDDTGNILMKLDNRGPVQISAHLTEVLPGVANWLLQKGVLQIDWCTDVLSGHAHLSYSLESSGSVVDPGSSDPCLAFKLFSIPNSNLYVIIYRPTSACQTPQASCTCTEMCAVCDIQQKQTCQCPCRCFSNYMDKCTHQINKTTGYRPCPGPHKHWQMQSLDATNKSTSVQACKPVCTAISGSSECQATKGCNWCSGGHYKKLPLCSEKCVHDRHEVHYRLPCDNMASLNLNLTATKDEVLRIAQDRMKQYKEAVVSFQATINRTTAGVILTLGTRDETEVPLSWLSDLSEPVQVTVRDDVGKSRKLSLITNLTEPTDARVELKVEGANFSQRLETALTLRNHIIKQIQTAVKGGTAAEIASTVSAIWPEEDKVAFWLERPTNLKHGEFSTQLQKLSQNLNSTYINVLDSDQAITNVTISPHYSSLCPANCSGRTSPKDCVAHKECIWDKVYKECTTSPVLPERIRASIYLPCLGLYQKLNGTEEQELSGISRSQSGT